jgi:hypothetical protein
LVKETPNNLQKRNQPSKCKNYQLSILPAAL